MFMLNQGKQIVGQITKLYNIKFSTLGSKGFFSIDRMLHMYIRLNIEAYCRKA